ncbi:Ff.00g066960.m01.CDS01 [Fusarium sp. VM40]|nr:Ff.00g066960.m01.CDS01 [Fusarium sp. VM40]
MQSPCDVATLNWLETPTHQQNITSLTQVQTNLVQNDRLPTNEGGQSSSVDNDLEREHSRPTGIIGDISDIYSLPTNWLPFDDIPASNSLVRSLDDMPRLAFGVDQAYAVSHQNLETQTPLSNLSAIHGQTLQQDHVSALIASMASDRSGKTQASGIGADTALSNTQATHYSDGAGFRESRAERYMRQRRAAYTEEHRPNTGHQVHASWLIDLNSKVAAATRNIGTSEDIPDGIFEEIISRSNSHETSSRILANFATHKDILLTKSTFQFFLDFVNCQEPLPYIQARILASIGLCQSRRPELLRCGYSASAMVAQACLRLHLLSEDDNVGSYQDDQSSDQKWITWRFRETRRRTGLFVWLTSCYLALSSERHPSLFPDQPQLRLPCREELWAAESPQAWYTARSDADADPIAFSAEEASRPTVPEVTLKLWRELNSQHSSNSFATVVIIHMLVHRRWNANEYLADAIRDVPQPDPSNLHVPGRKYLGSLPEYIKWRNQCCDCLDVLHWEALSLSAKAEGLEGPVLLHLHLARLSLLTPVGDLLAFAHQSTLSDTTHTAPSSLFRNGISNLDPRHTVKIWATQDRYKARLALVHAGAVLWHVRRYSSDSIVEPFTLSLTALVLWAYGQTSNIRKLHESTGAGVQSPVDDNGDSMSLVTSISGSVGSRTTQMGGSLLPDDYASSRRRMPSTMQLDRPMDDELVQYFIRFGESLRLPLEGVDDLCSTEGPLRILHEVSNLLMEQHKP